MHPMKLQDIERACHEQRNRWMALLGITNLLSSTLDAMCEAGIDDDGVTTALLDAMERQASDAEWAENRLREWMDYGGRLVSRLVREHMARVRENPGRSPMATGQLRAIAPVLCEDDLDGCLSGAERDFMSIVLGSVGTDNESAVVQRALAGLLQLWAAAYGMA